MKRTNTTRRKMKVIISCLLTLSVLFTVCSLSGSFVASALLPEESAVSLELTTTELIEIGSSSTTIEDFVKPVFGDRQIRSCEYIYNLDDNADYIYVEFEAGGYVVYAKETMEMMEYSPQGSLPYDGVSAKYYAGPNNYLQKQSGQFYHTITGERIALSEAEIQRFAQQTRTCVTSKAATKYETDITAFSSVTSVAGGANDIAGATALQSSAIEPEDWDEATLSLPGTKLIANYKYFLANPKIGDNDGSIAGNGNTGTCGPVAAQLLLGYANYYKDRRIIEDRFLNGYDDDTGTVIYPHRNPNHCTDPMSLTNFTTGTRSSNTGVNSFYFEMITRTMEPNDGGCSFEQLYDGIGAYLSTRLSASQYVLDYEVEDSIFFWVNNPIDSSLIKAEIDAGRPVIIGTSADLGSSNHYSVGYGYQAHSYVDGSGTYDGYVVHVGYLGHTCAWINSAWCDGYLSLKINHMHDYYTVGTITGTNRTEYKCYTCGHRTDAAIKLLANDRYVESVVTLTQGQQKDYYLVCKAEGIKLIQTFGVQDTKLELYNAEYNLIVASDDEGYEANALFTYFLEANTEYILRVISKNSTESNLIKIAVMPAYGSSVANSYIANYEDIYSVENYLSYSLESFAQPGYVRAITFDPRITRYYTATIISDLDTFVYVIDPTSTDILVAGVNYDDDSGSGLNPLLTTFLFTGTPYLIVFSAYSPLELTETKSLTLRIAVVP